MANKKINTGAIATSANEPSRPKLTSDIIADYLERMGGQATLVKPDGSQYNPNRKGRVNIGDRMTTAEKFGQAADVGLSNEFQKLPEVHARFDDRQVALQVQKELATGRLTTQKFFESPDKAIADQAADEIRRSDGLLGRGESVEVRKLGKAYEVVAVKQYQPVPSRGNSAVRSYGLDNDPEGRFVAFNKPEEAYAAPKTLKELQAEARRLEASGTQALASDTRTEFKPQAQSNWEKLELPARSPMTEQLLQVAPEPRAIAAQTLDTPSDAWKLPQAKEPKLPHFYAQMASGDNPLGTGSTVQSEYDRAKSAYQGYQRFGYAPPDVEFPKLRELTKLAESEGVKGDDALKAYIKGKQNAPLIEAGVLPKPELPMTARLGQQYISPKSDKVGTVESVGKKGVKLNVDGQAVPVEYQTLEKLKYTGNKGYGFAAPAALRPVIGGFIGGTAGSMAFKQLAQAVGLNEDQQNAAAATGGLIGSFAGSVATNLPLDAKLRVPTAREFAATMMGAPQQRGAGARLFDLASSQAGAIAPDVRAKINSFPELPKNASMTGLGLYELDGSPSGLGWILRGEADDPSKYSYVRSLQQELLDSPNFTGISYRGVYVPSNKSPVSEAQKYGIANSRGYYDSSFMATTPSPSYAKTYGDNFFLEVLGNSGKKLLRHADEGGEALYPAGNQFDVENYRVEDGKVTARLVDRNLKPDEVVKLKKQAFDSADFGSLFSDSNPIDKTFQQSYTLGSQGFESGQKFVSPSGGIASLIDASDPESIFFQAADGKPVYVNRSQFDRLQIKAPATLTDLKRGDGLISNKSDLRYTVMGVEGDNVKLRGEDGVIRITTKAKVPQLFRANTLGFATPAALRPVFGGFVGGTAGSMAFKQLAQAVGLNEDQQNAAAATGGIIGSFAGSAATNLPLDTKLRVPTAREFAQTMMSAPQQRGAGARLFDLVSSESGAIQPANPVIMQRQADRLKAQGYDVKLETFNPTQGWMDEYVTEVQKAPQGGKNILAANAPLDDGSIRKRLVDAADRTGIVVKQADGSIADILPKPNNLELAPNQRLRGTAYVDPKTKAQTIAVDAAFPKFGVDNTIAHEMGHILAGHTDGSRGKLPSTLKELEANAVAYGVQKKLGVAGNPRLQDAYLERYRSHLNMRQYQDYRSQIGNIDSERVQKAVDAILPYSVESQRLVRGERSQPVAIAPEIEGITEATPRQSTGAIYEPPASTQPRSLTELRQQAADFNQRYESGQIPKQAYTGKFAPIEKLTVEQSAASMGMTLREYRDFQERAYRDFAPKEMPTGGSKKPPKIVKADRIVIDKQTGDRIDMDAYRKASKEWRQSTAAETAPLREAYDQAVKSGDKELQKAALEAIAETEARLPKAPMRSDFAIDKPAAPKKSSGGFNRPAQSIQRQSTFIAESAVEAAAKSSGATTGQVKAQIASQRATGQAPDLDRAVEAIAPAAKPMSLAERMAVMRESAPQPSNNATPKTTRLQSSSMDADLDKAIADIEARNPSARYFKAKDTFSASKPSVPGLGDAIARIDSTNPNLNAIGQPRDATGLDRAIANIEAKNPRDTFDGRSLRDIKSATAQRVGDRVDFGDRIGASGLGILMDTAQAAQVLTESASRGEKAPVALTRAGLSVGAGYATTALASYIPNPYLRTAAQIGGGIAAVVGADKAIDQVVGRDAAREDKFAKDLSKLDLNPTKEADQWKPFANDSNVLAAYGNSLTAQIQSNLDYRPAARSLANLANSQSIDNARYASERGQSIDLNQQVGAGRKQMTGQSSTVYRDRGDGVTEAIGRRRAFSDVESRVLALQNLANESGYEVPRTGKFDPKLSEALEKLGYSDRQIGDYIQGRSKTIGSPAAKQSNQQQAKQQFALRSKLGKVTSSQMSEALSAERKRQGLKGNQKLDQGTVDSVFSSLAGRSLSQMQGKPSFANKTFAKAGFGMK